MLTGTRRKYLAERQNFSCVMSCEHLVESVMSAFSGNPYVRPAVQKQSLESRGISIMQGRQFTVSVVVKNAPGMKAFYIYSNKISFFFHPTQVGLTAYPYGEIIL